ncbi:MAG: phosphate ABC transporter substrate-binding/OmpA family protein [Pseudomonadota bacterium]
MPLLLRAAALVWLAAHAGFAQDVTLTSSDGAIELSGSLIAFDGEFYRVDSIYGPLTVSADGVTCLGPGCPDLAAFVAEARFVGAPVIASELLPQLIETFALDRGFGVQRRLEPDGASRYTLSRADGSVAAEFLVRADTTDEAFLALLNEEADIALALREPMPLEQRAAEAAGADALAQRARVIGLDALVPITARANPFNQIAPEALRALFSGEITSWADIGGPEAPISLHLPSAESGLSQAFAASVLGDTALTPSITHHSDLADLSDAVARDPLALGVTTLSAVGNARALALAGSCGFAIEATPETIKSEDYPLTAPLFLYTPDRRLPRLVREFLGFLETAIAERMIRRAGFVSQSITRTSLDGQGGRLVNAILAAGDDVSLTDLQRLAERMADATRLSPTIRFSGGSSSFDAQSRSAISRLARAIEQGDFDGRTLVFVGFSDGAGSATVNLNLSRSRADTVRRSVIEAAGAADLSRVNFRSTGFGEALPIACDDSNWGAAINRRVEIWLE